MYNTKLPIEFLSHKLLRCRTVSDVDTNMKNHSNPIHKNSWQS